MIKLVNKIFLSKFFVIGLFKEFGKIIYSPVYQKHVFLEIFIKSLTCPLI